MKNFVQKYGNKVFILLFISMIISGCSTTGVSPEQMQDEIKGFNLPQSPSANKALVYCIYRSDIPKVYGDKIGLYYANSTAERFENSSNQASHMLDIFTFGLTKEPPLAQRIFIGELEPGQFRTVQLEPGFYEFKRILVRPSTFIATHEQIKQMKFEPGKIYFMELFGSSFLAGGREIHNIYLKEEKDPLVGKYILFKNFKEIKE